MAAIAVEHVGLLRGGHAGAAVPVVRHVVEYVRDARTMPGLSAPVAVDVVPELRRLGASRELVRMRITRRRFLAATATATAGAAATGLYTWQVEPHWLEIVRRPLPVRGFAARGCGE